MKMNYKSARYAKAAAMGCLLAGMTLTAACGHARGEADNAAAAPERPDKALSSLMQSICDDDAAAFASLCDYPLPRRYPLREIRDSAMMTDYFPILVDANLRDAVGRADLDDWKFYGWRGWSLGDSTLLWFDDGLQFVDYESQAETALRKMLAREEILSLLPSLRGDWTPVETLVEADGDRIFRIDSNGDVYRLLEYRNFDDMRGNPMLMLTGNATSEGSAGYVTYLFADSTGMKAEYSPDAVPPVRIVFTAPGNDAKPMEVHRGYWRDYLR